MPRSSIIHSTPIESQQQQQQQQQQQVSPFDLQDEEVFKIGDDPSLEMFVRQVEYTSKSSEIAKSVRTVRTSICEYSFNTRNEIGLVYGVYFDENGTILVIKWYGISNKKFDVDTDYKGTPGLYELIFKKIPNDAIYIENDKETYKCILLMTNAHRRNNNARMPIKSNTNTKTLSPRS
ncbi:hypothetical protein G5I_04136 [Acromyrmex echinatior]|uniref:DUF8207 domain-containing protein n=1 Tax=Acromyrmex echinatior TaxID=103372 RepID=F4WET8_ACREC|nr:hypothetical protein G5I_04136 [Acromyrmex echinatior]